MESMIDFLRFRLFEREDFITLSPVDLQWRFLRRDAIAAGGGCQYFLTGVMVQFDRARSH
jgi:hypothetical protein